VAALLYDGAAIRSTVLKSNSPGACAASIAAILIDAAHADAGVRT
jgi:hypothetical protein